MSQMKQEILETPAAGASGFFADLGLSEPLLRAVLEEGYTEPTPIQRQAIPHALAGRDLFGCAQTGTGKTAAFALPMIERLLKVRKPRVPRGCRMLVLAPTRELAAQIHDAFRAYGRHANLRSAVIYGGVGQSPQVNALKPGLDVLIATPGRLLDLHNQRLIDLKHVDTFVLDEADRMLDMGFIHDVRRITALVPRERHTLFFSATLPDEVRSLAASMLRDPVEVRTARVSTPAETVAQTVMHVPQKQKKHVLAHLLKNEAMSRVIVFTRTKHGADKLVRDLVKSGVRAQAIHGNKSQSQRERALAEFKSQRPPVLVATDIAARGIDVDEVSHVVNFELPHEPETYVHRIGRTGRAGLTGAALAFCDAEERDRLKAIERLLRKSIPVRSDVPKVAEMETVSTDARPDARDDSNRRDGGRGRRSNGRGKTVIGGDRKFGKPQGNKRRESGRGERRSTSQPSAAPQSQGEFGAPAVATAERPKHFRKKHRRAL